MNIEIEQLLDIIKITAKTAVGEYISVSEPSRDEITETQAIKLGFGRKWIAHQCAIGALSFKRAGKTEKSPKIYSYRQLKELKEKETARKMKRRGVEFNDILKSFL